MTGLRGSTGSIAPFGIGLAALSIATVVTLICSSSLFLLQRRLTTLAEFAALSSAQSGLAAKDFISEAKVGGFIDLVILQDSQIDGVTSAIKFCSKWVSPLSTVIKFSAIQVCGQGAARSG